MEVPDFQSFMLPLLKFAADGMEHNQRDAKDALARHFSITESDRREMLPSGRQTRFDNRIAWANVYLRKAGFLEMAIRSSASFTRDHGCRPSGDETRYLWRALNELSRENKSVEDARWHPPFLL
ncbi:winged helix-turn-helix domain-containing protein [Methanothrix sp.]|jgi:restriction endonuclease Mrr|uniref:winged helix-turn-helix domain-containing protein n=1 Tax=Methanothrix sp. TaxID=90426 RepID=UPI003BB6D93D